MTNRRVSKLNDEEFLRVIENTPLVSIDLIVRNPRHEVFLALRKEQPAKGYWFVPGGRILKDETIDEAFQRIVKKDLKLHKNLMDSDFLGTFEHFYRENRFGIQRFGTHYVVLAYEIKTSENLEELPETNEQGPYKWFSVSRLLNYDKVHPNAKAFFYPSSIGK